MKIIFKFCLLGRKNSTVCAKTRMMEAAFAVFYLCILEGKKLELTFTKFKKVLACTLN